MHTTSGTVMKSTGVSYSKCTRIGVRIRVENVFISATGNVSSFEMVDAIRSFYRGMKETGEEESRGFEETLLAAASRIKSMGLTDESISRAFGIPVTTLRRKAEEYGLSWAVDKSETNVDRYKKVKTVAE